MALLKNDDANSAVGYREHLQPQSPQKKKLPTLDDERFNHAVAAVEGGKVSKSALTH